MHRSGTVPGPLAGLTVVIVGAVGVVLVLAHLLQLSLQFSQIPQRLAARPRQLTLVGCRRRWRRQGQEGTGRDGKGRKGAERDGKDGKGRKGTKRDGEGRKGRKGRKGTERDGKGRRGTERDGKGRTETDDDRQRRVEVNQDNMEYGQQDNMDNMDMDHSKE